jgi:hypothetical protein
MFCVAAAAAHPPLRKCHQELPQCSATKKCHKEVPQRSATKKCHKEVPQRRATKQCHKAVPQRSATKKCHKQSILNSIYYGAARSCTLITQPAPGAGSSTDDIHSAGTLRVSPPALLPLTPAERPLFSPLSSQSPRHAPPTRSRLASPCPLLRLAGLSRPPAHRATRAARPRPAP